MIRDAVRVLRALLVLTVLTGLAYPLAMTGFAQLGMRDRAEGSLVVVDGVVVGSSAIGQAWDGDAWFHGRPSAVDHDATASGGSNLGPSSPELAAAIAERAEAVLARETPYVPDLEVAGIPVDLVTASASGLDPHISPAAAALQIPRIAAVRGWTVEQVRALVARHTEGRTLGVLGAPRVNVLELNAELAALEE